MRWVRKLMLRVLPGRFFYGERLTVSARRLFIRLAIGVLGVGVGAISAGLLTTTNWREVLSGALLAWGVAIVVWSVSSYQGSDDDLYRELRRNAELDLLHGRLNHIAGRVGAPLLVLNHQLEHAVGARFERLAHMSGLDEFRDRSHTTPDGVAFWDEVALGTSPRRHAWSRKHNKT